MHFPFLSTLIILPIIGAILVLCTHSDRYAQLARWIGVVTSGISLLLCIPLWIGFDSSNPAFQFTEFLNWIPAYHVNYSLGIDGISLPMLALTNIVTFVVILASWYTVRRAVAQYLATFLIMQSMMVGVFCATDTILFYLFWEAMLIPIYLNIGIWGGERRFYASVKFFIFTYAGSALLLVALLYLYNQTNSFMFSDFYHAMLPANIQNWLFIAFAIAFAVKIPLWPLHTWLPDAHTEAPAGGSVVLAALMLKMGVYGFLRFNLPITPNVSMALIWVMIALGLIAVVYIGLIAIVQQDMKRLVAYSSIAHMGFAVIGTFMIYIIVKNTNNLADAYLSLEGAMMQMISHAFSTGALFIGIGILYDRINSRHINDFGGLAHKLPVFAVLMMIFALSNVGLPGTSGFVGEFMIILSAFKANFWVAFLAASTLVLGAAYTLWMYKRVFFGPVVHKAVEQIQPLHISEIAVLVFLAAFVILLGVYPEPVLNIFHASVQQLLQQGLALKIPVV